MLVNVKDITGAELNFTKQKEIVFSMQRTKKKRARECNSRDKKNLCVVVTPT
jgi:hypothetical protein